MINKALIFLLFVLFVSLCFAGGNQAIDQVTDNKIRIENIEKQQEKLSDRIDNKIEKQREYTDKEIKEEIETLLNDKRDVLNMREKWIDWVMLFVTVLVAILGIGITLYLYIKGRKQSKEFEEQKVKISEILSGTEQERKDAHNELEKLKDYVTERKKDFEELINEIDVMKKEFKNFVESAKADIFELSKDSLVKDKKINSHLASTINEILNEKEETKYDAIDWMIKGNDYTDRGYFNEAIDFLTKAIELNFNNPDGYINRGVSYLRNKKYDKALNDFDRAIEISPNSYLAYFNKGIVKVHKKEYSDAFEAYKRAITLKPNYSDTYMNLLELAIIDNEESIWKKYSESISKIYLNYDNMGLLLLLKSIAKIDFYEETINIDIVKIEIDKLFKKHQGEIDWSFEDLTELIINNNFEKNNNKEKVEDLILSVREMVKKHNSLFNKE